MDMPGPRELRPCAARGRARDRPPVTCAKALDAHPVEAFRRRGVSCDWKRRGATQLAGSTPRWTHSAPSHSAPAHSGGVRQSWRARTPRAAAPARFEEASRILVASAAVGSRPVRKRWRWPPAASCIQAMRSRTPSPCARTRCKLPPTPPPCTRTCLSWPFSGALGVIRSGSCPGSTQGGREGGAGGALVIHRLSSGLDLENRNIFLPLLPVVASAA
jgi:hypothetical protein